MTQDTVTEQSSLAVAKDYVVSFHFTRTDLDGRVLDTSEGGEPLPYIHGLGQIAEGLEEVMLGKMAGDQFEVEVPPEKGYGFHDEELLDDVAREAFAALEPLRVGMHVQVPDDETGNLVIATVVDLGPKVVTIDRNHPYASVTLIFKISVIDVRPATEQELTNEALA